MRVCAAALHLSCGPGTARSLTGPAVSSQATKANTTARAVQERRTSIGAILTSQMVGSLRCALVSSASPGAGIVGEVLTLAGDRETARVVRGRHSLADPQ